MQVAVAHAGSIDAVYALNPARTRRPNKVAAVAAAPETELERARREAVEAAAKLAALEVGAKTVPVEGLGLT